MKWEISFCRVYFRLFLIVALLFFMAWHFIWRKFLHFLTPVLIILIMTGLIFKLDWRRLINVRILLRLFANYTIFLMLITVYFGHYWIPNKKYDKEMTKTSASDKNFRFFFSSSLPYPFIYMKRHDKIFAMECTNTCHVNSRLNGHYCNFRLTLKILDLNQKNMLKSKLLLSYVGRKKKSQPECAKKSFKTKRVLPILRWFDVLMIEMQRASIY